ncbi:hypothetical protein Taro_029350 [Colocasia esculenta]|uniref:Uncharacterized protein n=1 Tax=Colocasia esculenta TaxID=4460 RepID=A0A843VT03_COLES|nr:hypothetical protein [Colocasia esculenta]
MGANKCPPPGDGASEDRAEQRPQLLGDGCLYPWRPQMWEIFHKLRLDYDICPVVAALLRWILIFSETSDAVLTPRTEARLRDLKCGRRSTKRGWTTAQRPDFEIMRVWKPDFETVRTYKSNLKHVGTKVRFENMKALRSRLKKHDLEF